MRNLNFPEDLIFKWENLIRENDATIQKVLVLRRKVYAHTDRNIKNLDNMEISFESVEKLMNIVGIIIKDIFIEVSEGKADISNVGLNENRFNALRILAQNRKDCIQKTTDQYHTRRK